VRLGLDGWQGEHEATALSHLALHADLASVEFNQALGDGEAQARPLGFPLSVTAHLVELVKDGVKFLGWNPLARILDAEFDPIPIFIKGCRIRGRGRLHQFCLPHSTFRIRWERFRRNPDPSARRSELDRVPHEIDQHLLNSVPVGEREARRGRRQGGQLHALLRGHRSHALDHLLQEVADRERRAMQLDTTGLDPGEIQEIADEADQAVGVALDPGEIALQRGRYGWL
jgi:hypothetical protein